MNYPEVIDYAPLHINAQALRKAIEKYDDPKMETVAFAIASYADPRGVAFPGLELLSRITGYTIQEVSRYAHWLQAAGVLVIGRVKAQGAEHAHNVYRFAKSFIRRVADVTSAHFIANVKKWRAEGRDVAQAIKKKARQSLDTLTEKAEKMAALFQDRPELMDDPERAAEIAGVADNPSNSSVSDAAQPVQTDPVEWENGATWDAPAETLPAPKTNHTATLAALFGISAPVDVKPVQTEPIPLDKSPLPLYMQNTDKPAAHSWRRHVPGYEEKATV